MRLPPLAPPVPIQGGGDGRLAAPIGSTAIATRWGQPARPCENVAPVGTGSALAGRRPFAVQAEAQAHHQTDGDAELGQV